MATGMVELAKALVRQQVPIQTVFVTGDNERLARRLRQILSGQEALVVGTRRDVATLLSAADIVVGKSGWLSLEEASAVGLHTLCIDALPGQEIENLRVHALRGGATFVPEIDEVVRFLEDLPNRLEQLNRQCEVVA